MSDAPPDGWRERATQQLIPFLDAYEAQQEALAAARDEEPLRLVSGSKLDVLQPRWAAYARGRLNAMHALSDAIETHPEGCIQYAATLDKLWDNITGNSGTWVA